MRKGIFFSLLCLIAVFAVACGGGNNAGDSGNGDGGENGCTENGGDGNGGDSASDGDDHWNRYVSSFKEGRSWITKSVTEMEGMDDIVNYTKYEVVSVTDEEATVEMTSLNADKEPQGDPTPIPYPLTQDAGDGEDSDADPVEWQEKEIEVEAGKFPCVSTDGENWMMKKYPAVMVQGAGGELVEFNE